MAAFGVVLVAAVVFLLVKGIGTSLDYYVTVHQALAQRSSLTGKTFRLRGIVAPDTVRHVGSVVDFAVEQSHQRIDVIESGSPPQLFKVGIPVIVQGHFDGTTFVSDQVIVDHTGNYSPQRDGARSSTGRSVSGSSTPGSGTGGSVSGSSTPGSGTGGSVSAGASALRVSRSAGTGLGTSSSTGTGR